MPHVEIRCFPGRTDSQKSACAQKVAQAVADTLGCKLSSVSVAIRDVPEENWKMEVWDRYIVPEEPFLYQKPGYTCDDQKE